MPKKSLTGIREYEENSTIANYVLLVYFLVFVPLGFRTISPLFVFTRDNSDKSFFSILKHLLRPSIPNFNSLDVLIPNFKINNKNIAYHYKRLYGTKQSLLYNIFGLMTIPIFLILLYIFNILTFSLIGNIYFVVLVLISFFGSTIIFLFFIRLYYLLTDKSFTDSLCVREIIFINAELTKEKVLDRAISKKILLLRMNYLLEKTLLIPFDLPVKNKKNEEWIKQHFTIISLYINERIRWVVVPGKTTLKDLRKDFLNLAEYYINGRYGDFDWTQVTSLKIEKKVDWRQNISALLFKLIGILFPLIIMGIYLRKPSLYPFIEIDSNIVALMFISWLLLAIDVTLELGFIDEVIKLAKGIKDLK